MTGNTASFRRPKEVYKWYEMLTNTSHHEKGY